MVVTALLAFDKPCFIMNNFAFCFDAHCFMKYWQRKKKTGFELQQYLLYWALRNNNLKKWALPKKLKRFLLQKQNTKPGHILEFVITVHFLRERNFRGWSLRGGKSPSGNSSGGNSQGGNLQGGTHRVGILRAKIDQGEFTVGKLTEGNFRRTLKQYVFRRLYLNG